MMNRAAAEELEPAEVKAKRVALEAQREAPLFHDSRLGGLIDDSWTVVRLLEAALPTELELGAHSKREIPGANGPLGALPFPVTKKELQLVREAATEFIKLVKAFTEEQLLQKVVDDLGDLHGSDDDDEIKLGGDDEQPTDMTMDHIWDHIFLKDGLGDANVVQAAARTYTRKRFGDPVSLAKLQDQLRDACLEQIVDPDTKLGRKSRQLVHNLNDMCIDLQSKAIAMRQSEVPLHIADDSKVLMDKAAQDPEPAEAQKKSKVARTTQ